MTQKDISKNIINKIKEEKITPDSKVFDYKNLAYWGFLIFMIFLGAISFSLILLRVLDLGFEWRYYLRSFKIIFVVLPYFWIMFFAIFIFLGFLSFRKTKRGYRYNNLMIIGFILLAIFVLGFVVHGMKMGSRFDKAILSKTPLHRMMGPNQEKIWKNPGKGMLGGEIINVDEKIIKLKSFRGQEWMVSHSDKTKMRKKIELKRGMRIAIVGEKTGRSAFRALGIRVLDQDIFQKRKQLHRHMPHKHRVSVRTMKTF